jgi:hypothetical protein
MKNLFPAIALILFVSSLCFGQFDLKSLPNENARPATIQPVKGWRVPVEFKQQNYRVNLDTTVRHGGNASVSIKSNAFADENKGKTVYLMQTIKADDYRGKRLRLSAFVKSENVERAALWLRMDGDGMKVLNLDTMDNRPITGTGDWQKYDIVLDVPLDSRQIIFGVNLRGNGQLWIDDIKLDEVSLDTPFTSAKSPAEWERGSVKGVEKYKAANREDYDKQLRAFEQRNLTAPTAPTNLDFEN